MLADLAQDGVGVVEQESGPDGLFAGRYRIERELGRGGAAIVYLAYDTRQERDIALKILHPELTQALGAQRFLREIRHSSSLQHPHLVAIHESGEADGRLYYVMPYMPGGTLRTRLAREKQLPIDEAIRITRDLAVAIAYAHSKGVVHRDIKPDNVLFSEAHASLADFGVARAIDTAAPDTITSTGIVVGTPAYMSPEQASGESRLDARTDQYSLACVLFEMITGLPPFMGATAQSVMAQRFTQAPPSMRAHRPTVPDHVERAVKRALATAPADRFAGVKEFAAALEDADSAPASVSVHAIRRRWFAAGAAAAVVTLAVLAARPAYDRVRNVWGAQVDTTKFVVLPFEVESRSSEASAVGVEATRKLYHELRQWSGLSVVEERLVGERLQDSRGSARSLGAALSLARSVGAGRLIWGSIEPDARGAMRIRADLYDVATGRSVNEIGAPSDGGAVAESFVADFARRLLWGGTSSGSRASADGTRSYPALQAYARGTAALERWDLSTAHREFQRAVEADAEFGGAHLWLARVQSWLEPRNTTLWRRSAERAVALRGELVHWEQQLAAALFALSGSDYPRACAAFEAMRRADSLDVHAWYGLGECQYRDDAVVTSPVSRSGFRFRSSWHAAGVASARALELEPRAHVIPHFSRLYQLFATGANQVRAGSDSGNVEYLAYPTLAPGDTVSYMPYPLAQSENSRLLRPSPAAHFAALSRNAEVMLRLTSGWVRYFPKSSEAWSSLASAREALGQLEGSRAESGALSALRRALSLSTSGSARLSLSDAEIRVLLKLGQFEAARHLADSVLNDAAQPDSSTWGALARLAGLTGRSGLLAKALVFRWATDGGAPVEPPLTRAAANLLAIAILGGCTGALEAEREIDDMMASYVRGSAPGDMHDRLTGASLSFLVPCTGGRSILHMSAPRDRISRLQMAWARRDSRAARAILDTLRTVRATYRPGDLSPNLLVREVWIQAQMGDSAGARRQLDLALNALPTLSASTLSSPIDHATLVQAMVLRADMAAAVGDAATARRWSSAVATLWKNADPALGPTLARMAVLTGSRR